MPPAAESKLLAVSTDLPHAQNAVKAKLPSQDAHIPVLDGVRGMAISMVLIFHFWQGMKGYELSPHASRALSVASIGQKGVDLFFVLSGFLITGILLRTKDAPHYFKNFYIRRSLRIFPLYFSIVFGCLIAGAIWSISWCRWENTWWYLCYLQNVGMTFWPGTVAGPGHFWSLAVEEHFYLFWPLAVLLFNRRRLALFSAALILTSIVIRAAFLKWGLDVFTFTLCRMDTLALGALLAIAFADKNIWQAVVRWVRWIVVPLAGAALGSFFILSGTGATLLQTFKYTLFSLLCGFVLVMALSPGKWNPAPSLFRCRWLRRMGKTSYAMYVFHPFIYTQIICRFYRGSWSPVHGRILPALFVELGLALGLTLFISEVSWRIFEQPLIALKDRFQYAIVTCGQADETQIKDM